MPNFIKHLLISGMLLAASALAAEANLITNGSLEGLSSGSFTTVNSGSSAIPGWTVTAGSVDWIRSYWQPNDGIDSVDLAGSAQGAITQGFNTVVGQYYQVSFYVAGNPDRNYDKFVSATVSSGNQTFTNVFSFAQANNTKTNMGWEEKDFSFTAASAWTWLTFSDFTFGNNLAGINPGQKWGAAIDNIEVVPTPEPGTLLLLGAGLLTFVGLRRKKFRA